jgi:tRNA 2-thiouridine synthesizing protein B
MATLHTVNKSPFSHNTLASCLRVCGDKDGILLLEDGVFGAISQAPCAEELQGMISKGVKVYALENDLKARGLEERLQDQIAVTDYDGFVQLSLEFRCVQSWY